MSARLSRRKLAAYTAEKMLAGSKKAALKELAAYLIDTGRTREMELIVRDLEDALAARGVMVASVVTAYPLGESIKAEVEALAGSKKLQLRETVNPAVLGGIRIDLPGKRFDGTIQHKLNALKANKV